jgi:hypothetical protein
MKGWGSAILHLFGNLLPYRAHSSALQKLKDDWLTDDAISSLACDAIFVGVGMYWTLQESDEYWRKEATRLRDDRRSVPPKPDIVKAWDSIESKNKDFQAYRANAYMGKATEESVRLTNTAFDMMNTHACQLGVCLTLTALADAAGSKMESVVDLAVKLTDALNAALSSNINQSRNRLMIFDRKQSNALNRIPRLEPTLSVYFRYFWLELLCTAEAKTHLDEQLVEIVESFRDVARRAYLDFLVEEQVKALKRSNPTWEKAKLLEDAKDIEVKALRKAMKYWGLSETEEFEQWLKTVPPKKAIQVVGLEDEQEPSIDVEAAEDDVLSLSMGELVDTLDDDE